MEHRFKRRVARQDLGQARRLGMVEKLVLLGAAQVAVDKQDPRARLGHDDRQVGYYRGLPLAGESAGDEDGLLLTVDCGKMDAGAQGAEGLGDGGFWLLGRDKGNAMAIF